MILKFTVPDGPDRKVYTVLRRELGLSAGMVRRLKLADGIAVNGESAFTDRMMHPGDVLTADVSSCEEPPDIVPERGALDIIYEDEGLIGVNKAPGVIVHPTHSRYTGTLANFAAGYMMDKYENASVHPVNRLDRDTSGVVLFAKNSYMMAAASEALREGGAVKRYTATVLGKMPEESGVIDRPIKRCGEGELKRTVSPDGKPAVTRYRTLAVYEEAEYSLSLLSLELETGRTHQIRVHCASCGCPLLGDCLYHTAASLAVSEKLGITRQLLHAEYLTFKNPVGGERLELYAPVMRGDMQKILSKFDVR